MSVPFDLEDPHFPDALEDMIMESGGYPYDKKLKRSKYEEELERLQIELVKVQEWVRLQLEVKKVKSLDLVIRSKDTLKVGKCHFKKELQKLDSIQELKKLTLSM